MNKCEYCKKSVTPSDWKEIRKNCNCIGGSIGHNRNCILIKVVSGCSKECYQKIINSFNSDIQLTFGNAITLLG